MGTPMRSLRNDAAAAAFRGLLWVVGGQGRYYEDLASADTWDGSTWRGAAALHTARSGAGAAVLRTALRDRPAARHAPPGGSMPPTPASWRKRGCITAAVASWPNASLPLRVRCRCVASR